MSKVKEYYYRQLESEFELELGYLEWLRDNTSEPDECELHEMEKNFFKESNCLSCNKITLNNTDYNPLKGA